MGSLVINGSGMNCKRDVLAGDNEALLYYCAISVVAFFAFSNISVSTNTGQIFI